MKHWKKEGQKRTTVRKCKTNNPRMSQGEKCRIKFREKSHGGKCSKEKARPHKLSGVV